MPMNDDNLIFQKKFRFTGHQVRLIQELARENGISENELMTTALTAYYSQTKPSEHILTAFARETKAKVEKMEPLVKDMAEQVDDIRFLLRELSLLYYYTMIPVLASLPDTMITDSTDNPNAWNRGASIMRYYVATMQEHQTRRNASFEGFLQQIWQKNHAEKETAYNEGTHVVPKEGTK